MAGAKTAVQRAEPALTAAPHPPANLEAEEYVLGAMMLSPIAIEAVRPILAPRHFYRESHARIYRAAIDLHDRGVPVDAILLADELDIRGELVEIGGKDRVREIATLVPAVSNAAWWAQKIVEASRLRRIISTAQQIERLAWEHDGPIDDVMARALQIAANLDETDTPALDVETWHRFESQAHDAIPVLVDGLWPEAAFGFIAAPPKKGKTWVALSMAIAIAAARPLFGHYTVPKPRPVLYAALEGHRAAIRARVGALARGMGIDPDGDQLQNLHWLYKPRGMNLADPAWAQRLRRAAAQIDAAIVFVDVLRAGARLNENDQEAFTALRHNLQPLNDDNRSVALLHHNVKLSEISKERDPGERMSGSGAMFGALDAAIYVTGSEDHARRLRLSFDTRDLAAPADISIELHGEGSGDNAGFTYRDTATYDVIENPGVDEADLKAPPQEIYDWVVAQGGDVLAKETKAHFDISSETLTRRLSRLNTLGIEYIAGRGKPGRLVVTPDDSEDTQQPTQLDLEAAAQVAAQVAAHRLPHERQLSESGNFSAQPSQTREVAASYRTEAVRHPGSGDLQGNQMPQGAAPYGSESASRDSTHPGAAEAEAWVLDEGYLEHDPLGALVTRYPSLAYTEYARLEQLAHTTAATHREHES